MNAEIGIYFTSLDGSSAKIVGNEAAILAIEDAFTRAGIKFNDELETWDEGYYYSTNPTV